MPRQKKGRPVCGWLVLDKPYDFGSTEAVSKIKWLYQAQKAGHAGTLDPLATGILPIALGEATKTVTHVQEGQKRYRFTVCWGVATSTDDVEGDIVAHSSHRPTRSDIEHILPRFTGQITQIPPAFSALKVDGQRAYDLARSGKAVDLPIRNVDVHDLILLDVLDTDTAVFEACTGKGTYIRALVRDIAEALGTRAHVTALRRTQVGSFTEEMAVCLKQICGHTRGLDVDRHMLDQAQLDKFLVGMDVALEGLPDVSLGGPQVQKIRTGQSAVVSPLQARGVRGDVSGPVDAVFARHNDMPVAICQLDGLTLRPVRVFNL